MFQIIAIEAAVGMLRVRRRDLQPVGKQASCGGRRVHQTATGPGCAPASGPAGGAPLGLLLGEG